jgi:pimeloyl-ACP methyl ester carboxylesterase
MPLQGEISVERSAEDASKLADHLKLKKCTLLCWSTGVQVAWANTL